MFSGVPVAMTASNGTSSKSDDIWMKQVDRVYRRFKTTTTNEPVQFTDNICQSFINEGNKDDLNEWIVKLGKYQKSIYKFQNEILALAGVGPDFQKVDNISKEINRVVHWVEEILCVAMVEANKVSKMHAERRFKYQTL